MRIHSLSTPYADQRPAFSKLERLTGSVTDTLLFSACVCNVLDRTKAAKSPVYPSVLSIGRNDPSAIYLDLGCFTGTDSRKVVADGWPAARVIGSDLRREWFELGWKLYGDKERCGVTFLAGDVFDEAFLATSEEHDDDDGGDEEEEATRLSEKASSTSSPDLRSLRSLNPLRGRIRCISAFSFFHLFDREPQLVLARKLAALLGPRARPGSVIFGSHQGMRVPGNRRGPGQSELFGHSPESWKELWECDVFPGSRRSGEQGVKVKVWAEFKEDGLPKMEVQLDRNKDGADNMPEQVAASSQSQLMQWSVTVV